MRKAAHSWLRGFLTLWASLCLSLGLAHAGNAVPLADDPALELRVQAIAEQLRCLVCQNQSIADSHAALAIDLRKQIREQLGRGIEEKQILDFMVARYGDFVLYRPPLRASTVALWCGPFALLFLGLLVLGRHLRQTSREAPAAPPDEADLVRARRLLNSAGGA